MFIHNECFGNDKSVNIVSFGSVNVVLSQYRGMNRVDDNSFVSLGYKKHK